MLTDAQTSLVLVAIGLFGLCYGLLRILKQVVDRSWPRDLIPDLRVYAENRDLRVLAAPLPDGVRVPTNGRIHKPDSIAWELDPEATVSAIDVASPRAN